MDLSYNNTAIEVINSNYEKIVNFYIDKGFNMYEGLTIYDYKNCEYKYIGINNKYMITAFHSKPNKKLITLELDIWIYYCIKSLFNIFDVWFNHKVDMVKNEYIKDLMIRNQQLINAYNTLQSTNKPVQLYCLDHIYNVELEKENYEKCKELVNLINNLKNEIDLEQN